MLPVSAADSQIMFFYANLVVVTMSQKLVGLLMRLSFTGCKVLLNDMYCISYSVTSKSTCHVIRYRFSAIADVATSRSSVSAQTSRITMLPYHICMYT